jgi:hypothetical protein
MSRAPEALSVGASAIIIRPMQTLLATAHHDLAERLTTVLRDRAAEARNTRRGGPLKG